eukprot:gene6223-8576_t
MNSASPDDKPVNSPYALYQSVDLEVDMIDELINGTTTLWLGYKNSVNSGDVISLHCRQAVIKEVFINKILCKFNHHDPLKMIVSKESKAFYSADIADTHYRAALEISRAGELEIVIPDNIAELGTPECPNPLPKYSPPDVKARYDKIIKAFDSLTEEIHDYGADDSNANTANNDSSKKCLLLQIKINYALPKENITTGYTFRKQPSICPLFEQTVTNFRNNSTKNISTATTPKSKSKAANSYNIKSCVYTTSFSSGNTLRDIDGVRCWLPCLDHLDQRLIFDLSIKTSANYRVLSSGSRISHVKFFEKHPKKNESILMRLSRFFTPNRLPAMAIGFFIGKIESYKMPLYKVKSQLWVATGLNDFISTSKPKKKSKKMNKMGTSFQKAEELNNLHQMNLDQIDDRPVKRSKINENINETTNNNIVADQLNSSDSESDDIISNRRLYDTLIYHSTLGLDLALRHIHKFVSRIREQEVYTIIFIHNLGKDFVAYDNFCFIDSSFLHNDQQIYLETTCHFTLISSYLYSWFKSSLLIDSYENEYIIHGAVQYLTNFYAEEIYGEEEGKYRYQKMFDSVIELEKQGYGFPLYNFFTESYEIFSPYFSQYLLNKSAVIYQLIENYAGGKEAMRLIFKEIIKSPSAVSSSYQAMKKHKKQPPTMSPYRRDRANSLTNNGASDSPMLIQSGSDDGLLNNSNLSPYSASDMGASSNAGMSPATPYLTSPYTPSHDGNHGLSPYPYISYLNSPPRHASDYMNSNSPPRPEYELSPYAHRGETPYIGGAPQFLGIPSLQRQSSITSETGWEQNINVLGLDCLSSEKFVSVILDSCGASSDFPEDFLENYVYNSGILMIRLNTSISQKIENKPRIIKAITEQVGFRTESSEISQQHCFRQSIKLRIAEVRDNMITEPMINISEITQVHQQQAYSRAGRGGGRKKTVTKKVESNENMTPEMLAEIANQERSEEESKTALMFVRDADHPIRFVILDPLCQHLADIHNISSDYLLIEQLFSEMFEYNVFYQCQSIRSISRSSALAPPSTAMATIINSTNHTKSDKNLKLQSKALYECLMGVAQNMPDSRYINGQHNIYIRIEAAFGLANWQNNIAPKSLPNDEYEFGNKGRIPNENKVGNMWLGMNLLIDSILELYTDPMTQSPLPSDFSNESSTLLRNALLLALSTIKSYSGITPLSIIKILLLFAEFMDINHHLVSNTESKYDQIYHKDDYSYYNSNIPQHIIPSYDETHYKAVIFLALSRVRFETIKKDDVSDYMNQIINLATTCIHTAYTKAKTLARISYSNNNNIYNDNNYSNNNNVNDSNYLPSLSCQGIDIAAAITCLGEMDCQAINLYLKGRLSGNIMSHLEEKSPYDIGPFSKFYYTKYFLPPNDCILKCTIISSDIRTVKDEFTYFLSTPIIRCAAIESFFRICYQLHIGHYDKFKASQLLLKNNALQNQHNNNNINTHHMIYSTKEFTFIPAMIEILMKILKIDTNSFVRQQISIIFHETIQDRPMRIATQAISLNNYWFCLGWNEPTAMTLPPQRSISVNESRLPMRASTGGEHMRTALKIFWRILTHNNYIQPTRSVLLNTWIYAYENLIPKPIAKDVSSDDKIEDLFFEGLLKPDRFISRNPNESSHHLELAIQRGIDYLRQYQLDQLHHNQQQQAHHHHSTKNSMKPPSLMIDHNSNHSLSSLGNTSLKLTLSKKNANNQQGDDDYNNNNNNNNNNNQKSLKFVFK